MLTDFEPLHHDKFVFGVRSARLIESREIDSIERGDIMPDVQLSMAIGSYDHVGDLVNGRVRVEGIDLTPM